LLSNFDKNYVEISVGTGETPTIREIVKYLKKLTESNSELHFGAIPMRRVELNSHCNLNMLSQLKELPKIHWRDGVRRIVEEQGRD